MNTVGYLVMGGRTLVRRKVAPLQTGRAAKMYF